MSILLHELLIKSKWWRRRSGGRKWVQSAQTRLNPIPSNNPPSKHQHPQILWISDDARDTRGRLSRTQLGTRSYRSPVLNSFPSPSVTSFSSDRVEAESKKQEARRRKQYSTAALFKLLLILDNGGKK